MCFRVYAVTGRNNLHGGALSVLIAAQFGFGVYFVFVNAVGSCKLPSTVCSFACGLTSAPSPTRARDKLGRVQGLFP